MKNTIFPHKFWRPFLDCMPQLFFRPQYVWFPVHLKGLLIPFLYETLVVNWQNWLFTLFHQSRSVLSPNPIGYLVLRWFDHNNHSRYHLSVWYQSNGNTFFDKDNLTFFLLNVTMKMLGDILVSPHLSVPLSVHPSRMPCPLCGSLPISWIIFIRGTNTSHEGTICYIPSPGQ